MVVKAQATPNPELTPGAIRLVTRNETLLRRSSRYEPGSLVRHAAGDIQEIRNPDGPEERLRSRLPDYAGTWAGRMTFRTFGPSRIRPRIGVRTSKTRLRTGFIKWSVKERSTWPPRNAKWRAIGFRHIRNISIPINRSSWIPPTQPRDRKVKLSPANRRSLI